MDELTVDGLIEWHEEQLAGAAKSLQAWRSDPAPTNDTRYFLRRYGEDHAFHTNAVELLKKQKAENERLRAGLTWYAEACGTAEIESVERGDVDLARAVEAFNEDCGDRARSSLKDPTHD